MDLHGVSIMEFNPGQQNNKVKGIIPQQTLPRGGPRRQSEYMRRSTGNSKHKATAVNTAAPAEFYLVPE